MTMTMLTIRVDDDDRDDVDTGMPWTANAYLDGDPDWEPVPGFGATPGAAITALIAENSDLSSMLSRVRGLEQSAAGDVVDLGDFDQYAEVSDRDKALERRVEDLFCAECGTHDGPFVVSDETEICLRDYLTSLRDSGMVAVNPLTYGEDGYPTAIGSETDYDRLIQEEGR